MRTDGWKPGEVPERTRQTFEEIRRGDWTARAERDWTMVSTHPQICPWDMLMDAQGVVDGIKEAQRALMYAETVKEVEDRLQSMLEARTQMLLRAIRWVKESDAPEHRAVTPRLLRRTDRHP